MTSDPPGTGGDPQREPEDEGRSPSGGTPSPGSPPPGPEQGARPPYPGVPPYPGQQPPYSGPQPPYPPPYPGPQPPVPGGYPPPGGQPFGGYVPYPHPGGSLDPADPLVATSFDQWVRRAADVVTRHWQPLLLIHLGTYVPGVVLAGLCDAAAAQTGGYGVEALLGFVSAVVFLAGVLVAQGVSFHYVTHHAAGRPVSVADAFRAAAVRAPVLLGWGLLGMLLIVVGIIALILPGLYVAMVLTAALTGVVVFERGAIDRCFSLFNRRFWPTVGRTLLFGVATFVFQIVVSIVAGVAPVPGLLFQPVVDLLATPVVLVGAVVSLVTYAELRHHESPGQVTTHRLSAELLY